MTQPTKRKRTAANRKPANTARAASAAAAGSFTQLGDIPVADFLARDWQRRPHLARGAIDAETLAPLAAALAADRLFALAGLDDVESRLITRRGDGRTAENWSLRHGPLTRRQLPARRAATTEPWTLLVQGVDLHVAAAAALLERFRFICAARLDDIMVSFATDGGGVGPHIDAYDVFLVQIAGRRRWRTSRQRDATLVDGAPIRVLRDFRPRAEEILEPGDLLYLPPGVAHDGVALGESITASVGFRAPAWQELVEPWFAHRADTLRLPGRYRDPGITPTRHPGEVPRALIDEADRRLTRRPPNRLDIARMLLAYLTEPKSNVVFDPPAAPLSRVRFGARAAAAGIALDLRTRMLYAGALVGINGESIDAPRGARTEALCRLADARRLDGGALDAGSVDLLYDWYCAGWLRLRE